MSTVRAIPCSACINRKDDWEWCPACLGSRLIPLIAKPQPSGKALLRAALVVLAGFLAGVALLAYWLSGWHL
jgi:hypothetical protein